MKVILTLLTSLSLDLSLDLSQPTCLLSYVQLLSFWTLITLLGTRFSHLEQDWWVAVIIKTGKLPNCSRVGTGLTWWILNRVLWHPWTTLLVYLIGTGQKEQKRMNWLYLSWLKRNHGALDQLKQIRTTKIQSEDAQEGFLYIYTFSFIAKIQNEFETNFRFT